MIRTDAQLSVSRFAELIDVPRRTYTYRLRKHRQGDLAKGPWPAPVVDRIEPIIAKYAAEWPAWGHRKIRAIADIDGHDVGSEASVKRAMARRDLLQPLAYQAERRQLTQARREVFVEPVERRNRVWQADFSEFETAAEGTWRLGGIHRLRDQTRSDVSDYADIDRVGPDRRVRHRDRHRQAATRSPVDQ